jgi:hypothetical protein
LNVSMAVPAVNLDLFPTGMLRGVLSLPVRYRTRPRP